MAITLKTITGKIVIPGTTIGIRAKVTATPMTDSKALSFPDDDTLSWGPVEAVTDANGYLPASFKIPTNSAQQAQLLWRFTAEPIDKHTSVPKSWLMGEYAITGTGTIDLADLVDLDVLGINTSTYVMIQNYVDSASASATASAASATSAAASASVASTLVTTDLGTTDGQSFALVTDANSLTRGALDADFLPRNGDDPGEAGFWADRDPGAKIARVRDRIFVGDAAALPGNYTAAEGSTGEYFPFSRWMARESTAVVASGIGRVAVTGLSRASLSPVSPAAAPPGETVSIGVIGFSYSDVLETESATRVVHGWGGYFEGVKRSGGQATFGVEIDIGNLGGGTATNNPYTMFGYGGPSGTFGLVVASGGSTGGPYEDTTFAIAVTNNGAKHKSGLIFEADAITGTDGVTGFGNAIQLAKGHVVQWLTPELGGVEGAYITSVVTENAQRSGIELRNGGLRFTKSGDTIATITHGAGAGVASAAFVNLLSGAAGSPAIVIAESESLSNVPLHMGPKGTSNGVLRDGAGLEKVTWNNTGLSFFGATPVAKPTISGSRGGNTALTSLLSALHSQGLVTDSTTA